MPTLCSKTIQGEKNNNKKKTICKILAALSVLLIAVFTRLPENIRGCGYGFFREVVKMSSLFNVRDLSTMEGAHFVVKYPKEVDEAEARLVLTTAENFFSPVSKSYNFSISKKIPVIIYASKEKLNDFFGWPASESAMGVYWSGVICVLSPKVWVEEADPSRLREVFINSGPMVHEYTHLVVDYKTRGNYPRWFTEGLAQYEEYKLTGFHFTEPEGSLNQKLYSFDDLMQNFDYLPNQSLAYRQSLAAVKFLVDTHGEAGILEIINYLSQGKSINEAMQKILGMDMQGFEQAWRRWVLLNLSEFG